MKIIKYLIVFLITIFVFSINVFAASCNLGVSSTNVYVGNSFTVTANINSAAAWNVHVTASGPVSGCSINQADSTSDAMDTNKTFSATCTATGTGTIVIRLSGDVTSASDGNAVNISGSKNVTVSPKPVTNNNNTNRNNQKPDNRSKNNNIKELSVEGYNLTKIDANNYTLTVANDVTSINVKATAEDPKSKVAGSGSHELKVGENKIEVVVTAENGAQNKININVIRKDGYYLEDLDSVLKNDKINDIIIKNDTQITANDLLKIKNSKKTINFNYINDEKLLMYSWIIDGSLIKNTNDLLTTISSDSSNKKDILRLSNYADGIFIEQKQTSNLPEGAKIKIFVGNKYTDDDLINIYVYSKNNDKLEQTKKQIKAENGYIEFETTDTSDYFVTMSNIPDIDDITKTGNLLSIKTLIIVVIIIIILIGLVAAFIIKKKKNNNFDDLTNNIDTNDQQDIISPNDVNTDTTPIQQEINSPNDINDDNNPNQQNNINNNNNIFN